MAGTSGRGARTPSRRQYLLAVSTAALAGCGFLGGGGDDGSADGSSWTFQTSGSIRTSPVVVEGTVYVGCDRSANTADDRTVYAIDAAEGTDVAVEATTGNVRSTPAVVEDTIYTGDDTSVCALVEFG